MKLKCQPSDFQVEEQIGLATGRGPFGLYRLTKHSLGTLEALDAIGRKWNLPQQRVALAGLKDKHASTSQFVTIHNGPRRGLAQTHFQLDYVNQVERPIHASDITGNRFQIVVRDLSEAETQVIAKSLTALAQDGLPNYFDSQRFGSLGESGEFIAKPWCLGDFERALWLAAADANVHDRPDQRAEKQILREQWGRWADCVTRFTRLTQRPSLLCDVAAQLARQPGDFRRALTIFPHSLRSLWLAAFQSHLWNQILARLIRTEVSPEACSDFSVGPAGLPFFTQLSDAGRASLRSAVLPLPSARLHLDGHRWQPLYAAALAQEGLELRQIRVKYPRDTFFSKGDRPTLFQPRELRHTLAADELHSGKQQLTLNFTLPRGSYATIVIKRLCGDAPGMADASDDGLE